jgi:hypothetical protein
MVIASTPYTALPNVFTNMCKGWSYCGDGMGFTTEKVVFLEKNSENVSYIRYDAG